MATTVAINGSGQFTLNGVQTFLLGLTYFDGINARQSDLTVFAQHGYNMVRVMLNWPAPSYAAGSFFDSSGVLKTTEKAELLAFIQAADALGIVVELVILHNSVNDFLTTGGVRTTAITNACNYFGAEPNVMFDVCNEIDLAAGTWSTTFASWDGLLDTAQALTSQPVYLSVAPSTVEGDGPFMNITTDVVDTSFMTSWMGQSTDVCAPHFKGNAQWAYSKYRRVKNLRAWLDANGHSAKPIFINEDNRWGTGYGDAGAGDLNADYYISTMLDAKRGGAAGWVHHSDASYDLSSGSAFRDLFTQSPTQEQAVYDRIGSALAADGIVTPSALLDDFNRANVGPPPSAEWVVCVGTGLKVVSNQAARDAVAEQGCSWRSYFYKDQEASFKVGSTPTTAGSAQVICLRLFNPMDFTSEHYEIDFANNATPVGVIQIYKVAAGASYTQLGANITLGAALATNDVLKASIVGDTLTVYVNGSSVGTRTDSTYPLGGHVALRVGSANTATFDDFTAGAIFTAGNKLRGKFAGLLGGKL